MKDVQNQKDTRNIYLHQVGVRELKYPVLIRNGEGEYFSVPANISLSADLEGDQKGTHMSRFVEVLTHYNQMDLKNIRLLLEAIRERLEARNSFCRFNFDYFILKKSPVTGRESYLAVEYANIVVTTAPILCVYPFAQKYFVKGVMIGSLKG